MCGKINTNHISSHASRLVHVGFYGFVFLTMDIVIVKKDAKKMRKYC